GAAERLLACRALQDRAVGRVLGGSELRCLGFAGFHRRSPEQISVMLPSIAERRQREQSVSPKLHAGADLRRGMTRARKSLSASAGEAAPPQSSHQCRMSTNVEA